MSALAAKGLSVVGASAGSGKTHHLTEQVSAALAGKADRLVPIDGLIAVTYTTKAQAELQSRLRQALIKAGQFERAEALPLAHVGTVHAVCLRLLKEFALDLGLSPAVDGLPQEAARWLLQEALEQRLSPDLRERLNEVALALELNWDARKKSVDWVTPVEQILTLARNNRIAPEQLPAMARRSYQGLQRLLGPAVADGGALESDLSRELDAAVEALERLADSTKVTRDAISTLREARHSLQQGHLPWSKWNVLTKLTAAKKAQPLLSKVQLAAGQYLAHPLLHQQLQQLCEQLFEAARVGLGEYEQLKKSRGLLDYIDMIDLALSALQLPSVSEELQARLKLLVVDEFQDTSPVQLALFTRLHALCGSSLWVGDRKQCIFEYAGADPELMDAAMRWAKSHGGHCTALETNFRSRSELVDFVSALFSRVFEGHGYDSKEVVVAPKRPNVPGLEVLPPIGVWWLQKKQHLELHALAEGVRRLLSNPEATPVADRVTGQLRPVRAGDIAVLVATNSEAERLASALKQRGVNVALARTGLMVTPEGTLLTAALRLLLDERDTLARAELDALLGFGEAGHEAWLTKKIQECDVERADYALPPWAEELRAYVPLLSPSELVERVFAALDLPRLAWRWPDPEQRSANLDALGALVAAYESRCTYLREAATLGGLLNYFTEAQEPLKLRDEERASDEQHVTRSEDTVVLSTYHKSKGLEWPVVVLGSLDREPRRHAFEVTPESDAAEFDAAQPLGQRWIRYWPWPLGQQQNSELSDREEQSEEGQRIRQREQWERARLLYVGFTRARDHLILAVEFRAKGERRCRWLDELRDGDGPVLELPEIAEATVNLSFTKNAHRTQVAARVWCLEPEAKQLPATDNALERSWFAGHSPSSANDIANPALPYWIAPSNVEAAELQVPQARVVFQGPLGKRMPFNRPENATWDQVGTALHAFLAADLQEHEPERHALAERILRHAALYGAFDPAALVHASNALREFVRTRWPGARWHRELPVMAVVNGAEGTRCIRGSIDLLLEVEKGVVLIDHKSFPGSSEQWVAEALRHAPQLFTYGRALETAGKRVLSYLVHFTVGGGVVELGPR